MAAGAHYDNPIQQNRLKDGMAFNLSVGLQGVPLSPEERRGSGAKDMEAFSMVIAGQFNPKNLDRLP